jgi:hypothetical protein
LLLCSQAHPTTGGQRICHHRLVLPCLLAPGLHHRERQPPLLHHPRGQPLQACVHLPCSRTVQGLLGPALASPLASRRYRPHAHGSRSSARRRPCHQSRRPRCQRLRLRQRCVCCHSQDQRFALPVVSLTCAMDPQAPRDEDDVVRQMIPLPMASSNEPGVTPSKAALAPQPAPAARAIAHRPAPAATMPSARVLDAAASDGARGNRRRQLIDARSATDGSKLAADLPAVRALPDEARDLVRVYGPSVVRDLYSQARLAECLDWPCAQAAAVGGGQV